jgi:hypothetical protein
MTYLNMTDLNMTDLNMTDLNRGRAFSLEGHLSKSRVS